MPLPKKLSLPHDLDPRLVTKTSLSDPKKAIALLIIMWYAADKPGSYTYGLEVGEGKAHGGKGILDADTVSSVDAVASKHDIDLDGYTPKDLLNGNPLFESQIESLNAAFQLIWHLASFSFADESKNLSAERTGGLRFRKTIRFTSNMDLIDTVAQPNESALVRVAFSWLSSGNINCDSGMEARLKRTLATFAETSFYKTMKGEDGIVYAPSGIYDAITAGEGEVSLVNEGAETQGTTRILKAAIKDGLNPMVRPAGHTANMVSLEEGCIAKDLASYSERAKNAIAISNIKLAASDTSVHEEANRFDSTPWNLIYFGAPGTGKSYQLNKKAKSLFGRTAGGVTRVTLHPDYTYSQFVGCYKPVSDTNDEGQHEVYYDFVPGPFTDVYVKAKKHPENKYVLLIEEINRANPAAVFGDVFQLLDRDSTGCSEYPVQVSKDLGKYLYQAFSLINAIEGESHVLENEDCSERCVHTMSLPSNMYLWATMNSADQGVYPMDTAFKRRWSFRYMGINENEEGISSYDVPIAKKGSVVFVNWNKLRKAINSLLIANRVNEDKLIGPYFIKESALANPDSFTDTFKNKVLLYLFEDVAKMNRAAIFSLGATASYSQICSAFDSNGLSVFNGLEPVNEITLEGNGASDEGNDYIAKE